MLAEITRQALERHGLDKIADVTQLYTDDERRQLADQLASTIGTGELLGRARIRERADDGLHSHQPTTFRRFDETTAGGPIAPMAPRAAVEYFRRLLPTLEIDADGFERQTNADALTLAVTTDQTVLERVHAAILERLETGSQRALLGRVGDQTVWFVPHPKAPPGSATILADVADLDAAWQADAEQYIPPGGGGETEIGGRRADFENFLATGKDVQAPMVVLGRDGSVSIEDGRHRLSVLRDMGIDQVAVTVPGSQANAAAALFGSSLAAEASALTGAEAIAKILDDAGVSSDNPQYAEMVFRTNAIESYNAGAQQELDEVSDSFPVWRYSNPNDGRSRESHAAKDGLYFSSDRPFADVRGTADSDVCNCRCTFIPVHRIEWAELAKAGVTTER